MQAGAAMKPVRILIALGLLVVTLGARAELRTYNVDSAYRDEVSFALHEIFARPFGPNPPPARVQRLPNGQLLIDASPEMHEQIAAVLEAIRENSPPASARLTLRYWVVRGTAGVQGSTNADLEALAPVLAELEDVHGDLSFEILDAASLMSQSGGEASVFGEPLRVEQRTFYDGSIVNAHLELGYHTEQLDERLEADFSIAPGEFLVLSERGASTDDEQSLLFYIVHWAGL